MSASREQSIDVNSEKVQPERYTEAELQGLRNFIEKVRNDKSRASMACWGDHAEHTRGY